jgi:hypothetical protein
MCVLYRGFGSNGFVTKVQSFPMDGHYRTNIINSVGHLEVRLDRAASFMYDSVQWLEHRHCTIGPSDSTNPAENG